MEKQISQAVIRRLPRYYRYLGDLLAEGVERVSSRELSERMRVTASQIRQDLNHFGGFGQQGYGYNVRYLQGEIGKILGLDMPLVLIMVGFVYIVETLSVILQVLYFKITKGKRLFKMSPIHHHFEMVGWKEEKIVIIFAGISALMCVIAWFGISGRF